MKINGIEAVETYQGLPVNGKVGDMFYIKKWDKLARWDRDKDDWALLDPNKWPPLISGDEYNDRRGAILAQRAKK